jgi:hypothetical protein
MFVYLKRWSKEPQWSPQILQEAISVLRTTQFWTFNCASVIYCLYIEWAFKLHFSEGITKGDHKGLCKFLPLFIESCVNLFLLSRITLSWDYVFVFLKRWYKEPQWSPQILREAFSVLRTTQFWTFNCANVIHRLNIEWTFKLHFNEGMTQGDHKGLFKFPPLFVESCANLFLLSRITRSWFSFDGLTLAEERKGIKINEVNQTRREKRRKNGDNSIQLSASVTNSPKK